VKVARGEVNVRLFALDSEDWQENPHVSNKKVDYFVSKADLVMKEKNYFLF
jgi:hypothetical protein